jgi:hypothetical protein
MLSGIAPADMPGPAHELPHYLMTSTATVASTGALHLYCSDRAATGEVFIEIQREA